MKEEGKKILESCDYKLWTLDDDTLARYVDLADDWDEVWAYGPQWSDAARRSWAIDIIRMGLRGEIGDTPGTRDDYEATQYGNNYDVLSAKNSERLDTLHNLYDCAEAIERDPAITIWHNGELIY